MPVRSYILSALMLVTIFVTALVSSDDASAHAFLQRSDPETNAIVPAAPAEAHLWFSERLEPDATSATLVDHLGQTIDGTSYRIGEAKELIVSLPGDLPNGTYSIVWQNISVDDGHPAKGYLPFTIGTAADIQQVTVPSAASSDVGAPQWLRTTSRWFAFWGLFLALAVWPIWSLVIAPSIRRVPGGMRAGAQAIGQITIAAMLFALLGNLFALLVQASEQGGSFTKSLKSTLLDTRYGELWIARIVLLGVLAALLGYVTWVWPWKRTEVATLAIIASFGLVVPFSLNAHASAQPDGRAFALAVDLLHLASAGLWGGGAIVLALVFWHIRRVAPGSDMRSMLVAALPRFSFLALAAWICLTATGAYAAWLEVGNLDAARSTDYGNAFLIKMALAAVLLGFGATHLIVVTRKIRNVATGDRWSRRFLITLGAEVVGIIAILLVTGWMTSEPPAREVVAQEPSGVTVAFSANGADGTLAITPGGAGPNHLRLTLTDGGAPDDAEALLRLTAPDAAFGTQEITLTSVGGNSWETHGSEFSLAGDWSIVAIVRKVGEFQWQATATATITESAAVSSGPSEPWRFGGIAIIGLVMLVIGAMAAGWAVTSDRGRSRKESAGIAMAGLVIGALFIAQARLDEPVAADALIADDATITRGAAVYNAQCLACHGVGGQGDGPQAAALSVPPADFTDPTHLLHSTASMETMVENGFPQSGMPAFADILSDEEVADVVAYIRSLGAGLVTTDVAEASDCTVEPRDAAALVASAGPAADIAAIDPGPMPMEWPQGEPASAEATAAITESVNQFVACTNAGDYSRLLALSTTGYLAPRFAALDEAGRQSALDQATGDPVPLDDGSRIGLQSISEVSKLADGRIAARVVTADPINHPHLTDVILIFAEEDGLMRIDEIRQSANAEAASSTAPASPVSWPLSTTIDGYTIELTISDGPDDARPVRITLRDSAGASIDNATIAAYLTPRGVGIPAEIALTNVDPGTYFGNAPLPESGTIEADIDITLPDGTTLNPGFTFTTT